MEEVRKIVITSEEDAWKALQDAIRDKTDWGAVDFEFTGWPYIHLKLRGEQFDSTITTKNMQGFIDLQHTLNRTYAQLVYNSSAKSLSQEDRDMLELVIKVEPGSSEFWARLEKAMEKIGKDLVGKMDGKQVVIVVCILASLYAGHGAWSDYLDAQVKEKEIESKQYASAQETERVRIIKEIVEARPALSEVSDDIYRHHSEMLKSVSEAEQVETRGVVLHQAEVRQIASTKREASEEKRIDGTFRVQGVESPDEDGIKIHVRRQEDGLEFTSGVKVITMAEEELLRDAIFRKEHLNLAFSAKVLRGSVTSASLISVSRVDEPKE
jgi:hypothetical protein